MHVLIGYSFKKSVNICCVSVYVYILQVHKSYQTFFYLWALKIQRIKGATPVHFLVLTCIKCSLFEYTESGLTNLLHLHLRC